MIIVHNVRRAGVACNCSTPVRVIEPAVPSAVPWGGGGVWQRTAAKPADDVSRSRATGSHGREVGVSPPASGGAGQGWMVWSA